MMFASICFLSICLKSSGQDSTNLKRLSFKLRMPIDNNSVYTADIPSTPYVLPDNSIQLYPGENLYVKVDQLDGKITGLHAISQIEDSSSTLIITFSQATAGNAHQSMLLKIVNPFAFDLQYTARMLTLNKKWVYTDVLPVRAQLASFETWPNVIVSIALGEWKFKAK
jgi:hypothetical protein